MIEQAPWDAPDTPASDLAQAEQRFLDAARALKEHHDKKAAEGNTWARARFANRMTWLSLDYGYQMITGQHLPPDLEVTQ
jgi:hypothetical protein